jgi:hypothetical protein
MNPLKRKCFVFLILMIAMSTALGCVPKTYRKHQQFDTNCKLINNYCLIKPDVEICEISAGGVKEIRDDWCAEGLENVVAALQKTLAQKNVNYKRITADEDFKKEVEDIRALYRAVSQSIRLHAIGGGPHAFPDKLKSFDYSIGPINTVLDTYDCNALIVVYGTDEISTSGRKALMALGAVAGAFTGVTIMPRAGMTTVNFSLIDSDGNILWYTSKAQGGYDLRKPESAHKLIDAVVADYPQCVK